MGAWCLIEKHTRTLERDFIFSILTSGVASGYSGDRQAARLSVAAADFAGA